MSDRVQKDNTRPGLRLPALFLGAVLSAIFCAATPYNNVMVQNTPLAGGHFPVVSFAVFLLLLAVANPLLSLLNRDWRFTHQELFLIWAMVTVSTGIAFTGLMRTFIINITSPAWFKTMAGSLGETLSPYLSPSLYPQGEDFIRQLYGGLEGGRYLGLGQVLTQIPWAVWIPPLICWGLFIMLVYAALLGMVGLFSHQWIANEKMNFPLLRVTEILGAESDDGTLWKFLTHRYFILGLSVPVILHLFNGLATYYPQVPTLPNLFLAEPYMPTEGLLAGFRKLKIYIYPLFIGFAFLTPKQVSFSLWFFFLLGGLMPGVLEVLGWTLPAAALGTTFGPVLSRVEEMQMVGAFGVFFFFIVWLAREHLWLVIRSLAGRDMDLGEEPAGLIGPRTGAYLFVGGFVGVVAWLMFFGMDILSAVLFLSVCLVLQLVTARLICQGGLPYFTLTAAPFDGFLAFLDTRMIAPAVLYLGAVTQKITFLDVRESLLPSLFHSSKLADADRSRHRFLFGVLLAIVIGIVVSFIAMLVLCYKYGVASFPDSWAIETSRRVHESVGRLLEHPEAPKPWSITFALIGAGVMLALVLGYHRFLWWPLHPIGYLATYSSAMRILWFSFFVGWMVNSLVIRYGGVYQFREARRLFVGLVVGDILMAVVWMIVGLYSSVSYHVLPL